MKFGIVALLVLAGFACVSLASTTAGEFTCPSGYRENIQCAAQCCDASGGTYDYGEETCTVETQAQWNAAAQCEYDQDCCEATTGNPPSSGCCGGGFILAGAGLAALGFAASRKKV